MKIVYTICRQRQFDCYMTDKREAVPQGAIIFAICTSERTIENQDEDLFAAFSDEEYYALRQMVNVAEQLETKLHTVKAKTPGQLIRKFFRGLRALLSGKSARPRVQAGKISTYRARTIAPVRLSTARINR